MFCEECGFQVVAGESCPQCGAGSAGPRHRKVVRLGRAPDNDLVIDAPGVSRYHAEIRCCSDGRLVLVDLDSQAGTFLSGVRVSSTEISAEPAVSLGSAPIALTGLAPLLAQVRPSPAANRARPRAGAAGTEVEAAARGIPKRVPLRTRLWTRLSMMPSPGGVVTLGVFNVLFGAFGLALPVLLWLFWRIDARQGQGDVVVLGAALASAAHQILLFCGGLGLILRRRWGRAVSLVWAALSCLALVAAGGSAVFGIGPLGTSELGTAAAIVVCMVLLAYPVLLLFLLNVPSYRSALGGAGPWPKAPRGVRRPVIGQAESTAPAAMRRRPGAGVPAMSA
ncbi:MAG: FHA domain-containing protein [Myxococcota bacterium]|nr:FHA domain-containing protein [Myxococcota bacterium]